MPLVRANQNSVWFGPQILHFRSGNLVVDIVGFVLKVLVLRLAAAAIPQSHAISSSESELGLVRAPNFALPIWKSRRRHCWICVESARLTTRCCRNTPVTCH